ncbi:MAG: DNA primase DnaG [Candidatus Woesearchaeota archaeon]|nr:DNA primase DnaG [Candidatus Woesearchaeota archaeon]
MGKIAPVSSKYIVHTVIEIEGVVDKPDVIGAIFGQTEGLLGADLELRELQRSGKIGRIEVNLETRSGKTTGSIIVPSSLDKAETAIVAASLEIIQRIGPCNAKTKVQNIEDVRVSKRSFVIERAKELLKSLIDTTMPDSQELADEVAYSVRVMEIAEYGEDRLPAGPAIDESDEIVVVEGRADVLNLLKHGIKNAIAMNGTSVPQTIIDLSKRKTITAFVDGDRGGDLILKELLSATDIDYAVKAPDGKEVEEITKKEIHKALRSRISAEQLKLDVSRSAESESRAPTAAGRIIASQRQVMPMQQPVQPSRPSYAPAPIRKTIATPEEKKTFKGMLEDLIGTRAAYILDEKSNTLGKVPVSELLTTIKSLGAGCYAVVFDGIIDRALIQIAERSSIKHLIAMDSKVRNTETRINILTSAEL